MSSKSVGSYVCFFLPSFFFFPLFLLGGEVVTHFSIPYALPVVWSYGIMYVFLFSAMEQMGDYDYQSKLGLVLTVACLKGLSILTVVM